MRDYTFGNYICALREAQGYSQFQLGALVGVSEGLVTAKSSNTISYLRTIVNCFLDILSMIRSIRRF